LGAFNESVEYILEFRLRGLSGAALPKVEICSSILLFLVALGEKAAKGVL
jgi:hypothetical protein